MNKFELIASIYERETLRYTPAGVPIVSATLRHQSAQMEAEAKRTIDFEISAITAGKITGKFSEALLGTNYQFTGFITQKSKKSTRLVFHIIDFKPLESEN